MVAKKKTTKKEVDEVKVNQVKFTKVEMNKIKSIIYNCKKTKMGGDPEFFIANGIGQIVSSEEILGKKRVGTNTDAYNDGVQGEISIEPACCRDSIISGISKSLSIALNKMNDFAESKFKNVDFRYGYSSKQINNYKIKLFPIVKLQKEELRKLGKSAKQFGCSPDLNSYTGFENETSLNGAKHQWRYAGGHIHITMPNSDNPYLGTIDSNMQGYMMKDNGREFIKLLDIFVGLPSVLLTRNNEKMEKLRRSNYGKAGDYRITEYGVEYRTLSNFWLIHPAVASLVYGFTRIAINLYMYGDKKLINKIFKVFNPEEIRNIINNSDVKKAETEYKKLKDILFNNSSCSWTSPFTESRKKYVDGLMEYGVFKIWSDSDIIENWAIYESSFSTLKKYIFDIMDNSEFMSKVKNVLNHTKKYYCGIFMRNGTGSGMNGFVNTIPFIENKLDFLNSIKNLESLNDSPINTQTSKCGVKCKVKTLKIK